MSGLHLSEMLFKKVSAARTRGRGYEQNERTRDTTRDTRLVGTQALLLFRVTTYTIRRVDMPQCICDDVMCRRCHMERS